MSSSRSSSLAGAIAAMSLAGVLALALTFSFAAPAGARLSCHSGGSKVIKRTGAGIVFFRFDPRSNTGFYFACSTIYGKRPVIARDFSRNVDVPFHRKSTTVSGTRAVMVYCEISDVDGQTRFTAVANLRTGRVATTSVPVGNNEAC